MQYIVMPMDDSTLIRAIGGHAALAAGLMASIPGSRFRPETIYIWILRDKIPDRWRYAVAQIAKAAVEGFDEVSFMHPGAHAFNAAAVEGAK